MVSIMIDYSMTSQQPAVRPNLAAALEDRGFRITRPRQRVIGAIEEQGEGFTAESLCDALQDVGRATVYRTIRHLLEVGSLCKLIMPDGTPKYSLARVEHHHHTMCINCGTVSEFRDSTIERALRSIEREIPDEIVGHRMEFYVVCAACSTHGSR